MKRVFYIFLILSIFSISAMSQVTLPDKVSVFLPDCLKSDLIEEKDLSKISKDNNYGQSSSMGDKKFWEVFSDRSKNAAYNKPNKSSGTANELQFNQVLRIAKIENGFALVYEEPNIGIQYPNISSEAKSKGWVPMDNLLLWHSCPANEFGILSKALLVYNMNKNNDGNSFQRYLNPDTKDGATNLDYDVNFYFVMKRAKNGLVLLARVSSMDGDTKQVLYGWVNEGSYTPWNQRSCLEFNWKYREVEDGLHGDSVGFFEDKNFSVVAANYHHFDVSKVGSVGKEVRTPGSILRLPILENKTGNDDIYHITYFAAANGKVSYDEAAEIQRRSLEEKNTFVENVKNVNLIIVVDGTQSMEPHFKSLYGAIKNACNKYVDEKYKVKLGLVIYRDYKDVVNGVSYCVESWPVGKMNDSKLFSAFETGGDYGIKSSPHDDYPEALYEGLFRALDTEKMKYSKEESYLIIVVGDCGNRWEDKRSPTMDQIKEKVYANNVNLISFQVHNMESDRTTAWYDYNDQMFDLILSNAEKHYTDAELNGEFQMSEDGTGYDYKVSEGRSFYVASMRSPELNQSMPVDELGNLINDNVLLFTQAINEQIDAVNNAVSNYKSTLASGSQRFDQGFLRSRLGSEALELFEKRNMLLALDGYTPKKNEKDYDYYKPVIFIEHAEFERLLSQFRKVYDATKNSDNRENYINAMKQLLLSMVPDMTPEELNKKGSAFIRKMISGLNESTGGLDKSFEEIADPNAVSNVEFNKIIKDFNTKFEALENIYLKKYKYTFKSNNQTYYWIPFDMLP